MMSDSSQDQRRHAKRTALILILVAVVVYGGFMAMAMLR